MIGLDFDNTIACHDRSFHLLVAQRLYLPLSLNLSKSDVRKIFRDLDREQEWTELQGIAYGEGMGKAQPFEGALEFVRAAVQGGKNVKIISHRTKYPIVGEKTDLHHSAMDWLMNEGFVGPGALAPNDIFFETTKQAKCERIRAEGCRVFLDDLSEILESPLFPEGVEGWLFAPGAETDLTRRVVRDWDSFGRQVL